MRNYLRGYFFERRLRLFLEKLGWVVIRAGKSGPVDLVALKNGTILFIECKEGNSRLRKEQKANEIELAKKAGATLLLVSSKNLRSFKKALEKMEKEKTEVAYALGDFMIIA